MHCDDKTLSEKLDLPKRYYNKSAHEILLEVMHPWIELLRNEFVRGFQEIQRYDDMTFRQYLRNIALLPDQVIDFVELVMSQTNQYDLSFTDLMMQTLHFNTPQWATIKGGLSRIIEEAASLLGPTVVRNAPVTEIVELPDGRVTLGIQGLVTHHRTFDKVILAIPPLAVQSIQARPKWPYLKEQAIRSLHEGPLYKMGMHFRTRFWEYTGPNDPTAGGQSQTDLHVRWIVYPSNDIDSPGSGCLIMYSGMTDAMRWSWLSREQRVRNALEDLNVFFSRQGVNIYEQYIESFDVCWPSRLAAANTMYLPGQFTRFFEAMKHPQANVYFAGEHISRHHTWIAGGVESAHETCQKLLGQPELLGLGSKSVLRLDTPIVLVPEVLKGLTFHTGGVASERSSGGRSSPSMSTVFGEDLDLTGKDKDIPFTLSIADEELKPAIVGHTVAEALAFLQEEIEAQSQTLQGSVIVA